ncbi:MAG TPA: agmatinase [Thalassobaculum sp.]
MRALRDKYGPAPEGTIFDPDFAEVGKQIFRGGRRLWPFAGVSTFLDAPFRPNKPGDEPDLDGLDYALIGVPMDLGVTNRAGSRLGPRAVRAVERIGPYEHNLKIAPLAGCAVADVGDVTMQSRYDLAGCHRDIEAYFDRVRAAGVLPLAVGGDHSISLPILKALGRDRPLGLVHIDAHCDTSGPYEGAKFHHGGPFRQAVLDGVLDPDRTIQIGIRGAAEYLWEFSYESGMTVVHAEDVARLGPAAVAAQARAVVGDQPFYVSFDIDSLDPAYAPGTGTPEIGGLTSLQAIEILRGLAGLPMVGGDVVEVAPQYDATSNTAHAAAQILFTIFCLARLGEPARQAAGR